MTYIYEEELSVAELLTPVRPIRIGIVGCPEVPGFEATIRTAMAMPEEFEITGVANADRDLAIRLANRLDLRCYAAASTKELISETMLCGVVFVLPPDQQMEALEYASEQELDAVCVGRFGSSPEEAEEMVQRAASSGVTLAAGHPFPAAFAEVLSDVRKGEFGTPLHVNVTTQRSASGSVEDQLSELLSYGIPLLDSPLEWVKLRRRSGGTIEVIAGCESGARGHFVIDPGSADGITIYFEGTGGTLRRWAQLSMKVGGEGIGVPAAAGTDDAGEEWEVGLPVSAEQLLHNWARACRYPEQQLHLSPSCAATVGKALRAANASANKRGATIRL